MTITRSQRRIVRSRAGNCCEYCRLSANNGMIPFHVDHIIPEKHGGVDHINNLCLACYKCNAHKGSDVAGFDPATGELTRLYHPREQLWDAHFEIRDDMRIEGRTPEDRTTVQVLQINDADRVEMRQLLAEYDEYPCKSV